MRWYWWFEHTSTLIPSSTSDGEEKVQDQVHPRTKGEDGRFYRESWVKNSKAKEPVVQQFCQQLGIKKVLKVWMHNNKHNLANAQHEKGVLEAQLQILEDFSISSSVLVHPNQVHLTVSIVSWTTLLRRKRNGLCSSW